MTKKILTNSQLSKTLSCFIAVMVLFLSSDLVAEEKPNPLDYFLNKLESFQADFTQTLSNEQGVTLETSSGVVYMQNPTKFRWVYQEPYEQLIITDGKTLWLYDTDLAQVTIRDIEESINNTPAAIISGQENIDKYYVTVDMGEIEGYNWIELTPKDTENQYSSVRLGFDDNNLGMMIMFDNLGQVTRIDFHNPVRNKRFGGPLFTFETPEGVDVVDERVPAEEITPAE
jgi:outer membrane lipoprotein carrier protein